MNALGQIVIATSMVVLIIAGIKLIVLEIKSLLNKKVK
jgi:hypothetical protein